ncbi:hypothetical protein VTN31DRAFT_2832 [Thermomyces dupontii]|uniref:uncharacterized protein n=1 Tax=Talaromyces thermophilus TaxID=28565 RepID=UPI003743833B
MGGRRRTSSDSDALRADRNTEHQLHEPVTFIPDNHSSSRPREATELHEYYYYNDQDNDGSSSPSSISTDEQRRPQRQTTRSTTLSPSTIRTQRRRRTRWFSGLRRFWARNVALTVPQQRNRDYFALERTFLAYIRTSVAFSMQGVLIAQLFHLYSPESDRRATRFTYATVGVPLSVTFQSCAIVVAILGAARFWRQQMAIARGKVFAGGWELNAIGGLTMSAILVLFGLSFAIIVEVERNPAD